MRKALTLLSFIKVFLVVFIFMLQVFNAAAQTDTLTKVKLVIGVSAPELAHAGLSLDLGKHNQLGMSAGIGPTWGGVWPSFNAEHRLYMGNLREKIKRRVWFIRQGIHYFPGGDDVAASLSAGLDFRSGRRHNGWTIDAGIFYLFPEERNRYRSVYPSLRFQFYNYFKKAGSNKPVIN